MVGAYESEIYRMIKETHDTYSLQFQKPGGFTFTPGMYCLFEAEISGKLVKRAYSLASAPHEDFLQITVKEMPNGTMSKYLPHLNPGDKLKFTGPIGKFLLDEKEKDIVFIAGGSGISPFRCMLRHIFDKKKKQKVILIYGCRSPRDIALHWELHEFLKHKNFKLFITVDHPDENWKFHTGFIDAKFIVEAATKPKEKSYYIVGPPIMVEHVKKELALLGVDNSKIHLDVWG